MPCETPVYSVNVPVPGRVRELASSLFPELHRFDSIRTEHTLLLKRLPESAHVETLQHDTHRALEGAPAVEVRVTGIDYFADPPLGSGPVVYLAVESPGLRQLHDRLTETFDPIDGLEGPAYVPHVTLARGGDIDSARRLASREVTAVQWTVRELQFFDGTYRQPISTVALPA